METTHQMNSETESNQTKSVENILNFRDELLAREILSCGIGKSDKILHFGSGFSDSLFFSYLSDLKSQNLVPDLSVKYSAVDVEVGCLDKITELNSRLENPIDVELHNKSMQSFLDDNNADYEWTIITGIFNKNLYGENQFQFIDKMIAESIKISNEGVVFTFDIQDENDDSYSIQHIISYIDSVYTRYRISRINEKNYVICINKYFHSIIPQ